MRRIQRYHVLSVLGDLKAHSFDQTIMIGSFHIANPANRMEIFPGQKLGRAVYYSNVFETMLKKLIEEGLIKRVENDRTKRIRLQHEYQVSPRDWDLQLTQKGRECLSNEQMDRSGDYSYYKNFDGTIGSAKKINPGLF